MLFECNKQFRKKVVLEIRPNDAMNVLPDGWIEVTHDSGMPVYLVSVYFIFSV